MILVMQLSMHRGGVTAVCVGPGRLIGLTMGLGMSSGGSRMEDVGVSGGGGGGLRRLLTMAAHCGASGDATASCGEGVRSRWAKREEKGSNLDIQVT